MPSEVNNVSVFLKVKRMIHYHILLLFCMILTDRLILLERNSPGILNLCALLKIFLPLKFANLW